MKNPVSDDWAYSRCAGTDPAGITAQTIPAEVDRVLVLYREEQPMMCTPPTVTCGRLQVQTSMEPTTTDPESHTLISMHPVLASKRQHCPNLTEVVIRANYQSNVQTNFCETS